MLLQRGWWGVSEELPRWVPLDNVVTGQSSGFQRGLFWLGSSKHFHRPLQSIPPGPETDIIVWSRDLALSLSTILRILNKYLQTIFLVRLCSDKWFWIHCILYLQPRPLPKPFHHLSCSVSPQTLGMGIFLENTNVPKHFSLLSLSWILVIKFNWRNICIRVVATMRRR